LSYPVLVEPNLPARTQGLFWSAAYVGFVLLCIATAWLAANRKSPTETSAAGITNDPPPQLSARVLWVALAACASILLLAVTNFLTQDVAAIPFLWILPLSVYLLTFILCFDSPRIYQRFVFVPLAAGALAFMAWRLWPERPKMLVLPLTTGLAASLFVCCMVCHGELVRMRPPARHLTSFYVSVSLGGALGGLFVGLLAPNLFNAYYEFPIGLGLFAVLAGTPLWVAARRFPRIWMWGARGALAVVVAGCLVFLGIIVRQMVNPYRLVARNFYGQLRVRDVRESPTDPFPSRNLIHGVINHGMQVLRAEYRRQPVSYFCPQSGIGRAMEALAGKPRRIGILGLGCGTLAAYGHAGDLIRIYEINPLVLRIAQSEFTYLHDTPASVQVAMGDGRLVLESEPSQQFDILVMDAFSGDSVPVHLITREAFTDYFRHLKPDGIVAVNISNAYLDLEPVIERAAAAFGKTALVYDFDPDPEDSLCFACTWALIMDPKTLDAHSGLRKDARVLQPKRTFRTWTDDYSNMFGILR
ncbi:MAG TPA: fused MFS/spermidine synthase, partial [Bryobacteraceae bacterium]|nr:fused MFS/spermidine synthase [Bryobacteraceae bacterium]